MDYKLSKHAKDVMSARNIKKEWTHLVFDTPSAKMKILYDTQTDSIYVKSNPHEVNIPTVLKSA